LLKRWVSLIIDDFLARKGNKEVAGYLDGILDGDFGERVHPGDLVLIVETKQLGFASGDQATWLRFDSLID
jgi:hypothetical protein